MSTPISIEALPETKIRTEEEEERDIQAQVQRMISLQYQQQRMAQGPDEVGSGSITRNNEPPATIGVPSDQITTPKKGNHSSSSGNGSTSLGTSRGAAPASAAGATQGPRTLTDGPRQVGVGRGTLLFPSTYNNPQQQQLGEATTRDPPASSSEPQYTGYGAVSNQEHEFHYGNPDYHDPYDDEDRRPPPDNTICERFCCLYQPIVQCLSQENMHRSFCFGAIDGLLTGSGIVSAFSALRLLTSETPWEARLAVVVFSTAACVADAVCMALGHIWTTYVVTSSHTQERDRERQLLDRNRGDAKAKLVDMLLSRGMLKIDAMSLADTLEGYPDLFVNALVGDSLLAGLDDGEDETDDGLHHRNSWGSFGFWKFPSYTQLTEMQHAHETGATDLVMQESKTEGLFMMFGFATFAVIPSFIWLLLPLALGEPVKHTSTGTLSWDGQTISLSSIVVSLLAVTMWFLGVWKSRYLDASWINCGIESVIVLVTCVFAAYGVGFALSHALGNPSAIMFPAP